MQKLARFVVVVYLGCGVAFAQGVPATGKANPPKQSLDGAPAAAKPAEPVVVANPAMWRVKGAHGTVYLFGSIHIMKPNVDWETAKVKAAFTASDVLYVEIANLDDAAAGQTLALQFGTDIAHPLSTKISKDDVVLLDTAAKSMGLPGESMLEPMQPWLVSASLEVASMMK